MSMLGCGEDMGTVCCDRGALEEGGMICYNYNCMCSGLIHMWERLKCPFCVTGCIRMDVIIPSSVQIGLWEQ
jgi:hypothetical protein